MTIDEAIKELTLLGKALALDEAGISVEAVQIGIEALKYLKSARDPSGVPEYHLLPGETEE
jgi:hypothetical protein